MLNTVAILSAIAFSCCYLLIPLAIKFSKDKSFVTKPAPGKLDSRSVPYLGGLVFFLVLVFLGMVYSKTGIFELDLSFFYRFLLSAAVIVGFGLYDDIREMNPREKLVGQFLGILILVGFGFKTQIIYFNAFGNAAITFFWIIFLVNAFNLLDILDGLAGGVSLINTFAFFLFSVLTDNHFVMLISVILFACLLAFLKYNLPPARIFMGDAGSQFIGFTQAVMAIALSFAPSGREIGLTIPLVMLALPLFDMLFVILVRIRQGRSIFLKSNDHFVFRMLRIGFSSKNILRIMIILAIVTNCCALVIFIGPNGIGIIAFLLVIGMMSFVGMRLSRLEINE